MKAKLLVIMALLFFSGCMYSPFIGEEVNHKGEEFFFSGWLEDPNKSVNVQILDGNTGQFITFATATSDSQRTFWSTDEDPWFEWQVSAKLPASARFWSSTTNTMTGAPGNGSAVIRGVSGGNLFTATEPEWDCIVDEFNSNGGDARVAYDTCANRTQTAFITGCAQSLPAGACGCGQIQKNAGCFDPISSNQLNDWPFQLRSYTEKLQGITTDSNNWYMTSDIFHSPNTYGSLYVFPLSSDLTQAPSQIIVDPFPDWNHPGDIDYYNGWIYVALEEGQNGKRNAIGAIPTNTISNKSTYKVFELPSGAAQANGGVFPWIARDPYSGFFYSSKFNPSSPSQLIRYKASYDFFNGSPTGFQECGTVTLDETIERVQGGDFSPSGRLYLSTDPQTQTEINKGIIKVVEMRGNTLSSSAIDCSSNPNTTATIIKSIYLTKQPGDSEEIEGITIKDLDDGSAYGGTNRGQIHSILLGKNLGTDDLYLKHHRISPIENL
tara:strand:+ start:588 stop:2069 length:1482 start_codon:yes stop_codon:yes gene_type:complete